jgi:uncharacterized protein YabE (DUF348 family)
VVKLRRAKPVELVLDGTPKKVYVHGLTVGEALTELGMPPEERDYVSPDPREDLQRGMRIELRNAVPVTVKADGKTREIVSSAPTVAQLLKEARVRVGAHDRLTPSQDTPPTPEMTIRIVRVRTKIVEERSKIPFGHREEKDAKLEKGLRKVSQQGADGLRVRRYEVQMLDGKAVGKTLQSDKVARKPRDEVLKIGTGQPSYHGGGRSETGLASWFQASGLTAAHKTLPMGTVVRVTNLANGRSVNVVVRDRGPFVEGRVIDLSTAAFEEIAPLGAGTARVKIEW